MCSTSLISPVSKDRQTTNPALGFGIPGLPTWLGCVWSAGDSLCHAATAFLARAGRCMQGLEVPGAHVAGLFRLGNKCCAVRQMAGEWIDWSESRGRGLISAVPPRTAMLRFILLLKINLPSKSTFILCPTLSALLGREDSADKLFFPLFAQVNFSMLALRGVRKRRHFTSSVRFPGILPLSFLSFRFKPAAEEVLFQQNYQICCGKLWQFSPAFFPSFWGRRALL